MPWGAACAARDVCAPYRPRLLRLRAAAPAPRRLHVRLSRAASQRAACASADSWPFYLDGNNLRRCDFLQDSDESRQRAFVYVLTEYANTTQPNSTDAADLPLLELKALSVGGRRQLLNLLDTGNASFLFLDNAVWEGTPRVRITQPPPSCAQPYCEPNLDSEPDPVILATFDSLRESAPDLLKVTQDLLPNATDFKEILDTETNSNMEEAACAWALNHTVKFQSWLTYTTPYYWIAIFLCDDSDYETLKNVTIGIENQLKLQAHRFKINFTTCRIDCDSESALSARLKEFKDRIYFWQEFLGAVATGSGIKAGSEKAASDEVALVLYNSPAPRATLDAKTRAVGGRPAHLAAALRRLLVTCGWTRLALLSDDTNTASDLSAILQEDSTLVLHEVRLESNKSRYNVLRTLESLRRADARIFFVNSDSDSAMSVLCAASELSMVDSARYAWILRERRSGELACDSPSVSATTLRHYTVSLWWRGAEPPARARAASAGALRRELRARCAPRECPPAAAPLADALLLLFNKTVTFLEKNPTYMYDLHGAGVTR